MVFVSEREGEGGRGGGGRELETEKLMYMQTKETGTHKKET